MSGPKTLDTLIREYRQAYDQLNLEAPAIWLDRIEVSELLAIAAANINDVRPVTKYKHGDLIGTVYGISVYFDGRRDGVITYDRKFLAELKRQQPQTYERMLPDIMKAYNEGRVK